MVKYLPKPVKKDEAILKLSRKAWATIKKRHLEELDEHLDDASTSTSLSSVLNPINAKMDTVKQRLSSGSFDFKQILRGLNDQKINDIVALFRGNNKQGYSEDRIVALSSLMVDEIDFLERCVNHCIKTKHDILNVFVQCYANNYHMNKGDDLVFNNQAFLEDAIAEMNFRSGFRRSVEVEANRDVINEPSSEAEGQCSIM